MTQLQPGDILVFESHGTSAKVIKFAQWVQDHSDKTYRFNHAAIYEGGGNIIEATPEGVKRTALNVKAEGSWKRVPFTATPAQRQKIVREARSWIGRGYGWIDILAFSLAVWGYRPKWVRTRLADNKTIVCSQLAAKAASAGGVNHWGDWVFATPSMLARDYTGI